MLTTGETWNGRYTKSFHQVGLPEDSRGTTPKRWISSNFWNGLFVVLHLASCNPLPLTRNTTRDAAVALWGLPHYKDLFLDDSEEWEEFEPEIPEIPSNIPGPTPGPPCWTEHGPMVSSGMRWKAANKEWLYFPRHSWTNMDGMV